MPPRYLPLTDIASEDRAAAIEQAAAIFFDTAIVKSFDSDEQRSAFYARWFGNYLSADPGAFFLALDGAGHVAGYLAGCVDSFSENFAKILDAIVFYTPPFCAALRAYPSHFHINVGPTFRRQGIGKALIARFMFHCTVAGSSGLHVVTGAASPAISFYKACGFLPFHLDGTAASLAVLTRSISKPSYPQGS